MHDIILPRALIKYIKIVQYFFIQLLNFKYKTISLESMRFFGIFWFYMFCQGGIALSLNYKSKKWNFKVVLPALS